ncbi:hypothetical protein DPQ33_11905 [Oceanidesulfovibrio indonesiensis]|uniref:HTH merR-type domain-containing protein n=1 Tax=Oceanidesulfovibrio indonesiensis TaxID=54767 RepID=A0A7M3MEC4_9BACT|nr:MerR family transcriptional regulator [Oceanidesulfovibrio indonesiensis]TVM16687.1 hypothetical protein DPQ33_11905 [Oceanidesulfovibrio indonesiensis]
MNPLLEPRFTFTEAALAAGVKPKTVRNWLDRGQIHLDAEEQREGEGWRRFSALDALRIAAVARLVERCIPVSKASRIVEVGIINRRCGHLLVYEKTPLKAVVAAFTNIVFCVCENGDDYFFSEAYGSKLDLIELGLHTEKDVMIFLLENIFREVFENLEVE